MLERVGRDDRGDDHEHGGGKPDRQEAGRDDGARDERAAGGGQRTVLSGQGDGEGRAATRRPFCAGAASSVNSDRTKSAPLRISYISAERG